MKSALDHDTLRAPSPALLRLFGLYLRWYLRRHFHAVRIANAAALTRPSTPHIIYVNHASWWDPLTCMLLARRLFPDYRHYGPMDAAALARYPLLRRLGLFPVEQGTTRGAAQFMRAATEIVTHKNSILWLTPQGAFTDARQRPLSFKPGLAGLLKRCPDATAIPLAIEYTFWDERLPEVLINVGEEHRFDLAASAQQTQESLAIKLTAAQDSLATLAQARNPNVFEKILAGSAGVGTVYDSARRLSSWMRGTSFQAEHTCAASAPTISAPPTLPTDPESSDQVGLQHP